MSGWAGLFATAFKRSRNPMALISADRLVLDVNPALLTLARRRRADMLGHHVREFVAGGPLLSNQEWASELGEQQFTGEVGILTSDGQVVAVQWGATPEVVTGRRLVLLVALSTSVWGRHFRREIDEDEREGVLTPREAEIVRLVALGRTGPEIAEELHLAHDTVRTHVRNAMAKLGARSRAHLVAKALGNGHALE
jgi:DNA-binding CsgD family transcriptional regulator